jgi:hypothetical protein
MHMPSQVRFARAAPLPKDVELVLRIAAGEDDAERCAAEMCDRSRAAIRQAAAFYTEQILLFPDADCYRTLGCTPSSSAAELRRNMALLLRWLHPDKDRDAERSLLARRVSIAWDTVKTPERRAIYDKSRKASAAQSTRELAAKAKRRPKFQLRKPSQQGAWQKTRLWLLGWLTRRPTSYGRWR